MNVALDLLLKFPLESAPATPPPVVILPTGSSGGGVSVVNKVPEKVVTQIQTSTPVKKMSKLAPFQTNSVSDFRFSEMPKLHDHVKSRGVMDGIQAYDESMGQWLQNAQRAISDQLSKIHAKIPPSNG